MSLAVELVERVEDAIWSELERQREEERFGPYVSRENDIIDGYVRMASVAKAAISAVCWLVLSDVPIVSMDTVAEALAGLRGASEA